MKHLWQIFLIYKAYLFYLKKQAFYAVNKDTLFADLFFLEICKRCFLWYNYSGVGGELLGLNVPRGCKKRGKNTFRVVKEK